MENKQHVRKCFALLKIHATACQLIGFFSPSGQREQMNLASSFIDGSDLYGKSAEEQTRLRAFTNGHMKVENCEKCTLSALYATLLHHHNRIADQMHEVNPQWDDERVYLEARRVLVAEIQHITLTEFLPIVLGVQTINAFNLKPAQGFFMGYSTKESPNVFNEVATAVLPIFQTMFATTVSVD